MTKNNSITKNIPPSLSHSKLFSKTNADMLFPPVNEKGFHQPLFVHFFLLVGIWKNLRIVENDGTLWMLIRLFLSFHPVTYVRAYFDKYLKRNRIEWLNFPRYRRLERSSINVIPGTSNFSYLPKSAVTLALVRGGKKSAKVVTRCSLKSARPNK